MIKANVITILGITFELADVNQFLTIGVLVTAFILNVKNIRKKDKKDE